MLVPTLWGQTSFQDRVGVKQGAVESPAVFSWLIGLIICIVKAKLANEPSWAKDSALRNVAYMDDILMWSGATSQLQRELEALQDRLAFWGLRLNVKKCQRGAARAAGLS